MAKLLDTNSLIGVFSDIKNRLENIPIKYEDLTEEQKEELRGPQGLQGPQGDSVIVGQGDLPLSNIVNADTDKAVTPKAVNDVTAPLVTKMGLLFSGEESVAITWSDSKKLQEVDGKVYVAGTNGVSVANVNVSGFQQVSFNAYKAALSAGSGNGYLWMFTSADGTVLESSEPIAVKTGTHALEELTKTVPANATKLYLMTNTSYTPNIYVRGTSFIIPSSVQAALDDMQDSLDTINGNISSINDGISAINESEEATELNVINIQKDLHGFKTESFDANKYIITSNGNFGSQAGYARSKVLNLTDNLGILRLITMDGDNENPMSFENVNLFAYSSETTQAQSTSLGYVSLGVNRLFDIAGIVEQQGWTTAKVVVFSIKQNSNGTSIDTTNWYLERTNFFEQRMEDAERSIGILTSKKGVFHYNAGLGQTSSVESNLSSEKIIKSSFVVERAAAFCSTNPCFDFDAVDIGTTIPNVTVHNCGDDTSPTEYNHTIIGAGHGDSAVRAITSSNHGKTFADIGSKWYFPTKNLTLTIIGIYNANALYVLASSANEIGWRFSPQLQESDVDGGPITLTHVSGATNQEPIVVTSINDSTQLRGAMEIVSTKIYADGVEITESGDYPFSKLEICQIYDVFNTVSLLKKIQSNVGNFTANPVLAELGADKVARHSNVYTYVGADLWFINNTVTFYQDVTFVKTAFTQQQKLSDSIRLYIPKALPANTSGVDYRTVPMFPSMGNSEADTLTSAFWENPLLPPDRYLEYSASIGIASGYLFDYGVGGHNRKDCINTAFVIQGTKKLYPYGIDSYVNPVKAGDSHSAICFRRYVDRASLNTDGVICTNVFEYDNKLYIYADYNAAGYYEIDIPPKYIGKAVDVFEKRDNVSLLTKISSSKLLVKVDEVEEGDVMYGYLVAQIR